MRVLFNNNDYQLSIVTHAVTIHTIETDVYLTHINSSGRTTMSRILQTKNVNQVFKTGSFDSAAQYATSASGIMALAYGYVAREYVVYQVPGIKNTQVQF